MKSARACGFKRFGVLDFSNSHFCFFFVGLVVIDFCFLVTCFLLAALCLPLAVRPHAHILHVYRLVFAFSFPLGSFLLRLRFCS
jgi:hypothetical protein